ncbi:hypothetical protein ACTXT7_006229 [Hymenolepis weldensis]
MPRCMCGLSHEFSLKSLQQKKTRFIRGRMVYDLTSTQKSRLLLLQGREILYSHAHVVRISKNTGLEHETPLGCDDPPPPPKFWTPGSSQSFIQSITHGPRKSAHTPPPGSPGPARFDSHPKFRSLLSR